jgi:hypothetical protein
MTREPSRANSHHPNYAAALVFAAALLTGAYSYAADGTPAVPSKHQLMKDCMAKQKAAESGKPTAEMRKACKDVAKNEKQNDDRAAADAAAAPQK